MVLFVFVKTTYSQCTITAAISTLYKYTILLVPTLITRVRPMKFITGYKHSTKNQPWMNYIK